MRPTPGARPVLVGLLGGVAAGKSAVAALFAERGAAVFDADRAAHDALRETGVREALVARFGPGILAEDGSVDRKRLGEVALATAETQGDLNAIVHPVVSLRIEAALPGLGEVGQGVVLLDAALLAESGWAERCDLLVFVDAPEEDRERRARMRGWPAGERERRESLQLPLGKKRRLAKVVVRNGSGNLDQARADVAEVWQAEVTPLLAAKRER
ncbi:MAG: dephospho-CoA kinase [Planctomycetales bacterium]|nr:dephospho-CoA kinase [Planctomycetales bacterium]